MKGFPVRDFFLILIGASLFVIPLRLLTRSAPVPHGHAHAESVETVEPSNVEAWVDLRFSHAPENLRIFQNGKVLFEGGGALREDADISLTLSEDRNALELNFRWSEEVEQAYAEVTLEAEGLPVRHLGFWGKGRGDAQVDLGMGGGTLKSFPITELGESHRPEAHHLLQVENLHVHYGNICALKNVNFEIGCGHCVGLLGQNGAGKSTLVKTLAGLNRKISGTLRWSGEPLSGAKAEIAYLPQVDSMDPLFPITVRGLVELGRYPHVGARGKWRAADAEVVDAALTALKLEDLAGRRLYQLSGGQLQRAHIARALAQESHVMLLDEPYAGLDEPSQNFLSDLIRDLADNGRLLLVCHHDLKAVPALFDHVLMLNREMVAFGPTADVFTDENLEKTFPGKGVRSDV